MINKQKTEKRRIGDIGEDIALKFLVRQGFNIIERNYQKKWGELDIIAGKQGIVRFIEVKTNVSRGTQEQLVPRIYRKMADFLGFDNWRIEVSHETYGSNDEYLPEENVHYWKQKRMIMAIQTYIEEKRFHEDQEWQIDIIAVKLDLSKKTAIIRHTEDVVFEV